MLNRRVETEIVLVEGEAGLPISFNRAFKFKDLPRIVELGSRLAGDADPEAMLEIASFLEAIGLDWDLTEDGQKVPCTKENLLEESSQVVTLIFQEVMRQLAPKSETANSSTSDGSSSTESGS